MCLFTLVTNSMSLYNRINCSLIQNPMIIIGVYKVVYGSRTLIFGRILLPNIIQSQQSLDVCGFVRAVTL